MSRATLARRHTLTAAARFGRTSAEGGGGGTSSSGDGGGTEGGNAGAGGGDGAPAEGGNGGSTSAGGTTTEQPKPLGITQADLDRIIGERVSAEQAKWQKKLDDAAALAGKNETEKLTIERDQAVQRAAETQQKSAERVAKTEAKVAAIAAGANPQRVAAIVRNADLSGAIKDGEVDNAVVAKAVDAVLKEYPEWKASATSTASGGELNGGGGGKPTFTRKQLEDMPAEEMASRIDEINEAIADGRVTG